MSIQLNPYAMSLIRVCLICITIVFVNSCAKNESRSVAGTRLKKISINRTDSLAFFFFKYDQDNKLSKITTSFIDNEAAGGTTTLGYDSAGRVSTLTYSGEGLRSFSDTLFYYNNGALVKKTGASLFGGTHVYSYDEKKRLISDSAFNGSTVHGYATFTYDADDNLVEWNVYNYFPWDKSWAHFGETLFSYDNRKSPLGDLGQLLYMIRGDYEWVGKNNVTQTKYWTQTWPTIFTYEYNADGLPKKATGKQNNVVVLTYEYSYD